MSKVIALLLLIQYINTRQNSKLMDQLALENIEFLAKRSIEDLHYSSRQWLFNIEFWRQELDFFQSLLDQFVSKAELVDHKKQIDHFQHLITYYKGELLDEFHQKTRRHEKMLRGMLNSEITDQNEAFREKHNILFDQIVSFDNQFKQHKLDFYEFMNILLSR